jgi:hypothetical protein
VVGSSNLRQDLTIPSDLSDQEQIVVQKLHQAQFFMTDLAPTSQDRRAKTPRPAKSITEFFEIVYQAFNDKLEREQMDSEQRPKLIEEFPDEDMITEVVTWKVIRRQPGRISAGPVLSEGGRREMRPTFRELVDSKDPGYKDVIAGQWFDNTVAFTCWAKSNKVANDRALWFEELMVEYNWFFQYSGLPRGAIFLERLEDQKEEQSNNKLVKRELRYLVRTERLYSISQKTLTELVIRLHSNEVSTIKQG